MLAVVAFAIAASLEPGCRPVTGDWIVARDLAVTIPAFASVDGDLRISRAPLPGARRIFRLAELVRLARVHQLAEIPRNEVCFAVPMAPPSPANLTSAMASVLGCDPAAIEVVAHSNAPIPEGKLEFARERLTAVPGEDKLLVWKGVLRYGTGRTIPVWAKVRIALPGVRVVARRALVPGEAINASDLELKQETVAPFGAEWARSIDEVAGRASRVRVEPGAAVRTSMLTSVPEVTSGEIVEVAVRRGRMEIRTTARADKSGRLGEIIPLTNIANGNKLRARVEAKGKLAVIVR